MSREEATEILMNEREGGVFLVRDSSSIRGDYVLCVRLVTELIEHVFLMKYLNRLSFCREDCKVSHYIINRVPKDNQIRYRIGDQFFDDLPSLIKFYKLHYLNTTPLIRPAPRTWQTVIAKYDFNGNVSCKYNFHHFNFNFFFDWSITYFSPRIPMTYPSKKVIF